jgi:hypothetical protein
LKTFRPILQAALAMSLASGHALAAEPMSRALAGIESSRATVKNLVPVPAPTVNVLDGRLDVDGRVVATCSSAENPAYRQWRDRMAERGRLPQER